MSKLYKAFANGKWCFLPKSTQLAPSEDSEEVKMERISNQKLFGELDGLIEEISKEVALAGGKDFALIQLDLATNSPGVKNGIKQALREMQ